MLTNERLKTIVVEDEKNALKAILALTQKHVPHCEILGSAENMEDALELIEKTKPDLLLLDIMLEGRSSFELFKKLRFKEFDTILITAYQEYAVKAFELSAADYLLKPLQPEQLVDAVTKIEEKRKGKKAIDTLHVFLENMRSQPTQSKKISLPTLEIVHVVELQHILYCRATQSYTTFTLSDGKEIMVSKTLKSYENLLSSEGFFRIHKSWLINLQHAKGYDKREGGFAIMRDDTKIPVSTFKKEAFLHMLQKGLS